MLARCRESNEELVFRSEHVVNCAGPWTGEVAGMLLDDKHLPSNYVKKADHAVAFNLVINRPPPSSSALALSADPGTGQAYFIVPHGKRTLAGTVHLPPQSDDQPSCDQISQFLNDLNQAVPKWNIRPSDICLLYTSPSPRDQRGSRMPSSA